MRKILSILGSFSLTAVATATVISCGARINPIEVLIGKDQGGKFQVDGDTEDYSLDELISAISTPSYKDNRLYNSLGNDLTQLVKPNDFSRSLNSDVYDLLSTSKRKIVKANQDKKQLRNQREIFAGRDKNEYDPNAPYDESTRYLYPSVDGIVMDWENKEKFYNGYLNTSINSIEGLYSLWNYAVNTNNEVKPVGAGLTKSVETAKNLFGEKDDENNVAQKFARIFIGLDNPYIESSFTKMTFGYDKSTKYLFQYYTTQSSVFDSKKEGTDDKTTSLEVMSRGNFIDNNPDIKDKDKVIEEESKKRIGQKPRTNPVEKLVLKGVDPQPSAVANIKLINDLKDPIKNLPLIPLQDSSTLYLINNSKKNSDDKVDISFTLPNQVYYQKLEPLSVSMDFASDFRNRKTEDQSGGPIYTLNFKLNNLSAVWVPTLNLANNLKKDATEDKDKEYYAQVMWTFVGYKFTKGIANPISLDETGKLNELTEEQLNNLTFERNHRFQDLEISEISVKEI